VGSRQWQDGQKEGYEFRRHSGALYLFLSGFEKKMPASVPELEKPDSKLLWERECL
jgi:hypothetical protein